MKRPSGSLRDATLVRPGHTKAILAADVRKVVDPLGHLLSIASVSASGEKLGNLDIRATNPSIIPSALPKLSNSPSRKPRTLAAACF